LDLPSLSSTLARHYSRFRVSERPLLTGHSHQAWPDVGFDAQQQAWLDAAQFVDDKWEYAAVQAHHVRAGFARLLGLPADQIALGQNTHELVTRWLSALPLRERPRLITTDGEFHSLRRQMSRLAEGPLEVETVAAAPVETLAERLAVATDERTAAVLVSSVMYETAAIVPHLDLLARACRRRGTRLLVDAYHHLNVVPFDLGAMDLDDAFVTGGGYKYCQLGEGNCFLRVPPGTRMRPLLTGWFAEFEALEGAAPNTIAYGPGAAAFAGATYDPTSHYRAAAVFTFFDAHGLTPDTLRAVSRRQVGLLESAFERLDLDPAAARIEAMPDHLRAGFLAVHVPAAPDVARALRRRGVFVDARGAILRLGPAPYVSDEQLETAVAALGDTLRQNR
jgi:kynureninase